MSLRPDGFPKVVFKNPGLQNISADSAKYAERSKVCRTQQSMPNAAKYAEKYPESFRNYSCILKKISVECHASAIPGFKNVAETPGI